MSGFSGITSMTTTDYFKKNYIQNGEPQEWDDWSEIEKELKEKESKK